MGLNRDSEEMAGMVVLTIKAALAPMQVQLAASDARAVALQKQVDELLVLRDRVVVVETKAAMPLSVPDVLPRVLAIEGDFAPMKGQVAAADARAAALQRQVDDLLSLRDRIVAMETKAAILAPVPLMPDPVNLDPIVGRLQTLETRDVETRIELRDRFAVVEAKATAPPDLGDVRDRLVLLETRMPTKEFWDELSTARLSSLEWQAKQDDGMRKDLTALRERVAVVETRASMPGPPGKDGIDGKSGLDGKDGHDGKDGAMGMFGKDGKDGADGMGWDDLLVAHDGERTFTIRLVKGERVKDVGTFAVPSVIYRGVYQDGKAYTKGDAVTWAGSLWMVGEDTTTKPGDGSKAYTLAVKKGRDGRDGMDAPGALPVVSVRPR